MDKEKDEDELVYDKNQKMAGICELFQFSPLRYKVYLAIGVVAACLAGLSMPLFVIFLADLYDAFGGEDDDKRVGKHTNSFICFTY